MSIVSVYRPQKAARSGTMNKTRQREFSEPFCVVTSSADVGAAVVMEAVDPNTGLAVPQIGETYTSPTESDPGAFCLELSAQEATEDGKQWTVTAKYGAFDAGTFSINPVDWPLILTFGGQKYQRAVGADYQGNAILNSARERFGEPAMLDDTRTLIVAERNELCSTFSATLAELYRDKVNNALWNGYAAKTVKIGAITTSKPQYDSNARVWYYTVTYPFEINRDTWNFKPLQQGYSVIDGSTPPVRTKILVKGHEPGEPQLLDASGALLATNGTPVFGDWEIYTPVDFGVFNMNFATALGFV